MITVRAAQRAAMERLDGDDDQVAFILDHLRGYFPGRFDGIPESYLADDVRAGMARARGWGLVASGDLCVWVSVMHEVSARFDEVPEFRAILADASLGPPPARLARLFAGGLTEAWAAAARLYDDADAERDAWAPDLVGALTADDGESLGGRAAGPTA